MRAILDFLVVDLLVAAALVFPGDVLGALDEAAIAGVATGVADLFLGADVVGHLAGQPGPRWEEGDLL